ncbi:carbonic anhydrase [Nonomuraea sp. MG754425]|uniref:beta-class carbonic anhydrase n=1 Tax=Nonomuraea sp. MG754425 TaxID=2570319 RepID=UPI001F2518B0|nr:carbonic anhydrase [Nonomuraea sp. MG754425]MCF6473045.1 carbonic anhydrase [Nonomuraea sp. MG754425]
MSVVDELIANAERYAANYPNAGLPPEPRLGLAIVTCMDARFDVWRVLGLAEGDAHVIRNAGGVVTADTRRSLSISQRLLDTTEIVIIHHTDCGSTKITEDAFREAVYQETGIRPDWAAEAFPKDADLDVVQSIARVKADELIPHRERVHGFVWEVETGRLRRVAPEPRPVPAPPCAQPAPA